MLAGSSIPRSAWNRRFTSLMTEFVRHSFPYQLFPANSPEDTSEDYQDEDPTKQIEHNGGRKQCLAPNSNVESSSYAYVLRQCGNERDLWKGKVVHDHIIRRKCEDSFLGNLLVQMYGKCGSLEEARSLFSKMQQRDVFTWTFMMAAYVHAGYGKEALHLYQSMQQEAISPNKFTFVLVLSACAKENALPEGKKTHALIIGSEIESDVVVGNAIVNLYGKCGDLRNAWKIFDKMPERDVVSWNSMLVTHVQNGKGNSALQLFQHLFREALIPNKVTFISIVDACTSQAMLSEGKRIHIHILAFGLGYDVNVGNTLVHMYAKCGSLQDALCMFHEMPERNVVSWTSLISAYTEHGLFKEVDLLFQQMELEGVLPNNVTFVCVISAIASRAAQAKGMQMHAHIVGGGFESDVVVGNALVNMYGKCGNLDKAQRSFDEMPKRDEVSWNSLIAAYSQQGHGMVALGLFEQMRADGMIPDRATYVSILEACCNELDLHEGQQVHSYIRDSGLEIDTIIGSALVSMYGKCGSLDNAREVFNKLPEQSVVSWSAMIAAYAQHGQSGEALQLFLQMKVEGVFPDEFTFASILSACLEKTGLGKGKRIHACIVGNQFESDDVVNNALISMYGRCGSLVDAERLFDKVKKKNVVTWTAMITACAQHGQGKQALLLFRQMQLDAVIPSKVTYVSILDACASQAALEEGNAIYQLILSSEFELDVILGTAIVNLYSKCGRVEDAQRVFDKMPKRTVASWNSLLTAYAQHAKVKKALQLCQEMQLEGLNPDEVTFLTMLSACSHAGLVDEACQFFVSMSCDLVLKPTVEHYNCLIDLLGRAGRLDEVEKMLKGLPCEATATSWMSFLSACRMHSDVERGECAATYVSELEPENNASYVLLSNIYAAVGRWEDAAKVRT